VAKAKEGRFDVAALLAFGTQQFCVSIYTFVLVKQENRGQGRFSAAAFVALAASYSAPVFVLFTSKASKLRT
jgi:hypothetical protein